MDLESLHLLTSTLFILQIQCPCTQCTVKHLHARICLQLLCMSLLWELMERVEISFISLEGRERGKSCSLDFWFFFKGVRGKASEGSLHAATPPFLWSTRVLGPTSTYSISERFQELSRNLSCYWFWRTCAFASFFSSSCPSSCAPSSSSFSSYSGGQRRRRRSLRSLSRTRWCPEAAAAAAGSYGTQVDKDEDVGGCG